MVKWCLKTLFLFPKYCPDNLFRTDICKMTAYYWSFAPYKKYKGEFILIVILILLLSAFIFLTIFCAYKLRDVIDFSKEYKILKIIVLSLLIINGLILIIITTDYITHNYISVWINGS